MNLQQVTPFFHVDDLDAAVKFFVEKLGFKALVYRPDYAYVDREGVAFRLLSLEEERQSDAEPPPKCAYVDVRDVDALWAELRPKLREELSNNPEGPSDRWYGQREFTVFGPEHLVLFFGQAIKTKS